MYEMGRDESTCTTILHRLQWEIDIYLFSENENEEIVISQKMSPAKGSF